MLELLLLVHVHFLLFGKVIIGNPIILAGSTASTYNYTNLTAGNYINSTFQNGSVSNYFPVLANAGNFTGLPTFSNSIGVARTVFLDTISALLSLSPSSYAALIDRYGYPSLFFITLFEGASAPIPSEIVIPAAGALSRTGHVYAYFALLAMLVGSMLGTAIDYVVAYKLGREGVYKYASFLRIKQKDLDNFDSWFEEHGSVAVFTSRLLPVIRSAMNFPAGFSKMNPVRFFAYSFAGILMWDSLLFAFGYYLVATTDTTIIGIAVGLFIIVLYLSGKYWLKGFNKKPTKPKK